MLKDGQYMAFSRNKSVSNHYMGKNYDASQTRLMLTLHFDNIPQGVPLIWFKDQINEKNKAARLKQGWIPGHHGKDIEEVLFPPGTLYPYNAREHNKLVSGSSDHIRVRYIPDYGAKTMEGKRIIRYR
jgi:hypothetical protein